MKGITTREFISELMADPAGSENVCDPVCEGNDADMTSCLRDIGWLKTLRTDGLIEESDILHADEPIDRGSAARLLHIFIRDLCNIQDERDITAAYELMDLFDCRICAGHIAQVYVKGIMEAADIDEVCIFDRNAQLSQDEAHECISKAREYYTEKRDE